MKTLSKFTTVIGFSLVSLTAMPVLAATLDDVQAPRGQEVVQAPRGEEAVQAPRGEEAVQAPRSLDEFQAPRG